MQAGDLHGLCGVFRFQNVIAIDPKELGNYIAQIARILHNKDGFDPRKS